MAKIDIQQTVKILENGGLVVFPTDTVYGLLVDASNEKAVEKLIAFKERPKGKPISVFVTDIGMMRDLAELNDGDEERLKQILPGPFTVVLKSRHSVSKLLESETGTLGLRLPDNKGVHELMKSFGKPVTATSANRSGHPSVHSIEALMNQLNDEQKKMIDLIVDAGHLSRNKPSTVVDMTTDELKVLREGDLSFSSSRTYTSHSTEETIEIAKKIIAELGTITKPVCLILEGDLGAGKTQFVKGVAEYLKIEDRIISPTFVISYEYPVKDNPVQNLIHMDLYNVKEEEEFKYLGMEKYMDSPNIFCIEWGEKAGNIIKTLKEKTTLIYIHIRHVDENTRELKVSGL